MTDALSIVPLGRSDTGEAAVLGGGSFQDFGRMLLNVRAREADEAKKREAQVGKIMQDDIKAKWATDAMNYFIPKQQEIRDQTIELYKKNKGRLSEMDVFEIESKWNKLKSEAEASNALYNEEMLRVKELEDDPEGIKYMTNESRMNRSKYNNPWEDPNLAKEIEEAGGIMAWRAKNSKKYGNVSAYDKEKDIREAFKDDISKWYDRDQSGKIKWNDRGDFFEAYGYEGIDKEKLATRYSTFWNRSNDKGVRFRKESRNWVDKNFDITPEGIAPKTEEAKEMYLQIAPKQIETYTPEQKREFLAYLKGMGEVESIFPKKEISPLIQKKRDVNNVNVNTGEGDGNPQNDFLWTTGKYQDNYPEVRDELEFKKFADKNFAGNMEKAKEAFKTYYMKKFPNPTDRESPFVTVTVKQGKENPSLTVSGKDSKPVNVATLGFYKAKTGDWKWVASESAVTAKDMFADMAKTMSGIEPGKESKKEYQEVTRNISKDKKLATELAGRYGFKKLDDFYKYLDTLVANSVIF